MFKEREPGSGRKLYFRGASMSSEKCGVRLWLLCEYLTDLSNFCYSVLILPETLERRATKEITNPRISF